MNTLLNADQSATFLATKLRRQEPFSFWRFGDGFLELMQCREGATCDGESYTQELAWDLDFEVGKLKNRPRPNTYFGDWLTASFKGAADPARYEDQHRRTFDDIPAENWLHFEALLLMRESEALVDFYRAVREDPRRKLYMGPWENEAAAAMLGADFLETPMRDLSQNTWRLTVELLSRKAEVVLFGAGMAGNIPVIRCWQQFPERTYISLGSALDPLGRGRSRKQQISPERARELFRSISAVHTAS